MKRKRTYGEGFVKSGDYNLHYLEWGKEGPEVILLHGSAPYCSAHDLGKIGAALSEKHHIIAFDLIGHSDSDDPKDIMGFKEHVMILHQAAEAKGFRNATLVGWSYGGWLSMVWAHLYPHEVDSVVLLDIVPVTYTKPTPQDTENTPEFFHSDEEAVEFFLKSFTPLIERPPRRYAEESVRRSKRDDYGRVYPLSHHTRRICLRKDLDLWSIYSEIKVPMLLIWGSASFIPAEAVKQMRAVNRYLSVVEVRGANHLLPVSHPMETISAVKSFLDVE
jgi:pimeloyl-ACP methyl ester carboxylesterase